MKIRINKPLLLATCLTSAFCWWWIQPCYVQPGIARVASLEIKRAMKLMGPYKDYRIIDDKRLEVLVDEKWLFLKH